MLELLHANSGPRADPPPARVPADAGPRGRLPPRLSAMLERVGADATRPTGSTRAGEDPTEVLLALSELELLGLLGRGDGGRYVPREPLSRHRYHGS